MSTERLIANAEWWSGWCLDQGDDEHDRLSWLLDELVGRLRDES